MFAARIMWGTMTELTGAHNAAWREWFESAGIEPYPVRYAEPAAAAPPGRGRPPG
jgi:LPS sulfotransferase NodH